MPPAPLVACPGCQQHVQRVEPECPHCGAALRDAKGKLLSTAGAALMGLTLGSVGCWNVEPEYGVPDDSDEPTKTPATSDTGDTGDIDPSVEPEYGVPDTSTDTGGVEPEYGVPDTSTDTGGVEPDYGVPDTSTGGVEPDYGVPDTDTGADSGDP